MQLSLFCDYRFHLKTSAFYIKYDALFLAVEAAWAKIPRPKRRGRTGYGDLSFLKALIYKYAQAIKSIPELLRDLESRPVLCEMIGFIPGQLPDASRFYAFLLETNNSKLEKIHHAAVKLLLDAEAISLDILIADSKPVMANTKHNNPKNPGRSLDKTKKIKRNPAATFGYYSYLKQPTGGKKKFTFFWGYRTHVLVSAEGVPLVEITKPNNIDDATVARMLFRKLRRVYGQKKGRIFLADSAYDKRWFYDFIGKEMNALPFIPINKRNEQPEKLFGANGLPLCQAGLEMKYCGRSADIGRMRKKFRCSILAGSRNEKAALPTVCPCANPKFSTGKCYGCTAYIDITDDARAQVPRQSKFFQETYSKRTEVERYFSRMGDREVEQTTHFNYRSVRNQMTIAHLTLALTAVAAALILKQPDKIRCFRSFADAA